MRSSLLQAVSLASTALTFARSRAAASQCERHRLQARLDQATTEIGLLREELSIKDARWSRLRPRRRPHYTPIQRMRILQVKAARHWSSEQAAQAFLVDEQTLQAWMRRLDEQGERALIQTSEPVNRFPDFVRYLVKQLKAEFRNQNLLFPSLPPREDNTFEAGRDLDTDLSERAWESQRAKRASRSSSGRWARSGGRSPLKWH